MEPEKENRCLRRCKRNKKKRLRIKKKQAKRLEEMMRPTIDSLSQLSISQPSTSQLGTTETGLPSLDQLYISQPLPVQRPLTTSNQSTIPSLMQLRLPSFLTRVQRMHSPLPISPPPPSPIEPPLPASPPPPQPPPPPYDPPDDDSGNSGGEAFENDNYVIYTPNVLSAMLEAHLNFLRDYLRRPYSGYCDTYSASQN